MVASQYRDLLVESQSRASIARGPRGTMTRKQFLRRSAALAGGLAGLSVLRGMPVIGASSLSPSPRRGGAPKPIPGGFDASFVPVPSSPLIHVLPPGVPYEMSTITDFNGVVAAAEIQGTASGNDDTDYWFDADMRFMKGAYIDETGRLQEHAFGFV